MKRAYFLLSLLVLCFAISPACAGAKYAREGFVFPADRTSKIVLIYPDLFVGSKNAAGEQVADQAWIDQSYRNMQNAIEKTPFNRKLDWTFMRLEDASRTASRTEVQAMFNGLTGDIIFKVPQGTFPLKDNDLKAAAKLKGNYDYAIATELAKRLSIENGNADYAMVMNMYDAYSTTGAKLGSVLEGVRNVARDGVNTAALPPHRGNAMLVDLSNGAIVWFYGDGQFGGDPREADGAIKRMRQVMTNFPGMKR